MTGTARSRTAAAGTPTASYTPETGNHAAVYLSQDRTGIRVYDQWTGQPVHQRVIRFEGGRGAGSGSKSNDGKLFRVVVVEGVVAEIEGDM